MCVGANFRWKTHGQIYYKYYWQHDPKGALCAIFLWFYGVWGHLQIWSFKKELTLHGIIQSWAILRFDSAVEWTVRAGSELFVIWTTSCAVGLDCGICQPSLIPFPFCPPHLISLQAASTPSTHALRPFALLPAPSLPYLPHPPRLSPDSHDASLHLLVNPPSQQASGVLSHLPLLSSLPLDHSLALLPTH